MGLEFSAQSGELDLSYRAEFRGLTMVKGGDVSLVWPLVPFGSTQ